MFRQSLAAARLSDACARSDPVLRSAAGVGAGALAYERLDRLERDLNMLQRHVYRGAPGPTYPPDGAACGQCAAPHGSARSRDARADRPGRGIREPARTAAQAGRAAQRRNRAARQPRLRSRGSRPGSRRDAAGALRPRRAAPARVVRPQYRSGRDPTRTSRGHRPMGRRPAGRPRSSGTVDASRRVPRDAARPPPRSTEPRVRRRAGSGARTACCRAGRRPSSTIMRSA